MAIFKGGKDRDDTFTGTDADDRFVFDPADLTGADRIVGGGGAGTDTLAFTAGGTISSEMLAGVSGVERIELSGVGNKITLTAALLATAAENGLAVIGGAGNDVIDASGLSEAAGAAGTLFLQGGAGDDVITGVSGGSDGFHNVYQTADGGVGADTIDLSQASFRTYAYYDPDDIRLALNLGTLFVTGRASIDLTQMADQSIGDRVVVTGATDIDASASAKGVRLVGTWGSSLRGGSGNDVLTAGSAMYGGKGADTFIMSSTFANNVYLQKGDFEAGERIYGKTDRDSVSVVGSVDLRTGTVRGVEELYVAAAEGAKAAVVTLDLAIAQSLTTIGAWDGKSTVKLILTGGEDFLSTGLNTQGMSFEVIGGEGSNTITVGTRVFGGAGDDVITARGDVRGEAGDDRIGYYSLPIGWTHYSVDGGEGSDTLTWNDPVVPWGSAVTVTLAARDQTANDNTDVRGFENVDFSASDSLGATVIGNAGANVLWGTQQDDVLKGGAGDDVLRGGAGYDRMTGGAGADTFEWTALEGSHTIETIDFNPGEDHLAFSRGVFDFAGRTFDTIVSTTGDARAKIAGADLIVLDGGGTAASFLSHARGGGVGQGVFVIEGDGRGNAILYHAQDASFTQSQQLDAIAQFRLDDISQITLSDFAFI